VHVAQGFSSGTIAHPHFPFLFPSLLAISFPFPSQKADVDGRASVTEGEEAQSNSHLFQAIMHHSYMTEKQMQSVIVGRIKR